MESNSLPSNHNLSFGKIRGRGFSPSPSTMPGKSKRSCEIDQVGTKKNGDGENLGHGLSSQAAAHAGISSRSATEALKESKLVLGGRIKSINLNDRILKLHGDEHFIVRIRYVNMLTHPFAFSLLSYRSPGMSGETVSGETKKSNIRWCCLCEFNF
jgi:hypothetical protein